MAEGGRHHQESCSSGTGSMDENSTHIKLMSFGVPSMETEGPDLAKRRLRAEAVQTPTDSQINQASPRSVLAERQETFRTIQSECSSFNSPTIPRDIYRNQAMAERQESFRTLSSEQPNFEALPIGCGNQPMSTSQENHPTQLITSVSGAYNHGFNIIPSIENNEAANIPVRTASARHINPLQSSSDNGDVSSSSNSLNSNNSRAARSVSQRQAIDDNTLILELPLPFMKFLSCTFDRQDCKNWKDLVDLYNWNYKQITVFKNRHHPEGVFCSLLNENEFQQYNIRQLKEDLQSIPRRDALDDLHKMILKHNSEL